MKRLLFGTAALILAPLAPAQSKVVAVDVNNVIHPITVEIIDHALAQAARENASLVLIRLNTPGGLVEATREIVGKIVDSKVPVAAYVTPSGGRAASAGFFLLVAADVAAMAPGTTTGASSVVNLAGEMDATMRKKVENDTSAALRTIVETRGRNVELAEQTVLDARAFTEKEAMANNLIDLIAPSEQELFAKLNGRQVRRFDGETTTLDLPSPVVTEYQPTMRENMIQSIANPNIAFIILILGAAGIYLEFSSPGLIVPGIAGGILILLGLSALSVLPINWLGVALLGGAFFLFVLEAKIASHGILAIGGAVSMVLGAMLLVDGPPEVRIQLPTALGVTLPFALITAFLLSQVMRARRNKVTTGSAGMIGELGMAQTALAPAGRVFVHGEYWDAVSSAPAEAGARVRITAVSGLKLSVEPAPQPQGEDHA